MSTATQPPNVGWRGSVREFLLEDGSAWQKQMVDNHQAYAVEAPVSSQIRAWTGEHAAMAAALSDVLEVHPSVADWGIVFEFELPREQGRRPDVVLLTGSGIIVLEFKGFEQVLQAHVDQTAAYARDLSHYHEGCRGLDMHAVLVLTRYKGGRIAAGSVEVTGTGLELCRLLTELVPYAARATDINAWLIAPYAPLPTLVAAARRIFRHEPLPAIRRAQSAGVGQAVEALNQVAEQARGRGERHLALVTGAPGAGKTLVGLQFVYEGRLSGTGGNQNAVFLSGNGPLITVLQHALGAKMFVQAVHGFLKQHGGQRTQLPTERIWVFDEAQRAWDQARVLDKRGTALSEPADFLALGSRMKSWVVLVGLIGEGQEIHLGEEAGIGQWATALQESGQPWTLHCPDHIAAGFADVATVISDARLELNASLRSHIAEDIHDWVRLLLEERLGEAGSAAQRARLQGFALYLTRDLDVAKEYARQRYLGEDEKRFGLLASSKAKSLPTWGIENSWSFTRRLRTGPWYNDPPESRDSCCQLREVATEFSCQGLELDLPIVAWGEDMVWGGGHWRTPTAGHSKAHDPRQLRLNSYRVLLTRGRDGIVIFVPPVPLLNDTAAALLRAGCRDLQSGYLRATG